MGKADITSETGNGQYAIQLDIDSTWIDHELVLLNAQIAQWPAIIAAYQTEIDDIGTTLAEIIVDQEDLDLTQASERAFWNNLQQDYNEWILTKKGLVIKRDLAELKLEAATKRKVDLIAYLATKVSTVEVNAWCADLTTGLTGTVATVEVANERYNFPVQIRPAYSDSAVYNSARDGQLQPAESASAAGVFYNLAMLPGKQKWNPQYRYGTITAIDWCDVSWTVSLESIVSRRTPGNSDIPVNQETIIEGDSASVNYMENGLYCFDVGDEVLIEFTDRDWEQPKIIGFKDNPKSCTQQVYLRAKINGNDLRYGGQKFGIKFTDYNGADQEPISYIRGGTDTTKYQYAGPFDLSTWDKCTDIEIHLYADRSNAYWDNSAITTWISENGGGKSYEDTETMFVFYEEDVSGDLVFVMSTQISVSLATDPESYRQDFWKYISASTCSDTPGDPASIKGNDPASIRAHIWPRMMEKTEWETNRNAWHDFRADYVKHKNMRSGATYSLIGTIYETFTASVFLTLMDNTESSIYNHNTGQFVTDAMVIGHDFTWTLVANTVKGPQLWKQSRAATQINYIWTTYSKKTPNTGFSFPYGDLDVSGFNVWYSAQSLGYRVGILIQPDPWDSSTWYYDYDLNDDTYEIVSPFSINGIYGLWIMENITETDQVSTDDSKFIGDKVDKYIEYSMTWDNENALRGVVPFRNSYTCNASGGAEPSASFIAGTVGRIPMFGGENDPLDWIEQLPGSVTDWFRIVSDRQIVLPNTITEFSKSYKRDGFTGPAWSWSGTVYSPPMNWCDTCNVIKNPDGNFTISNSNLTLPEIWF